jgi:hypothetical protein
LASRRIFNQWYLQRPSENWRSNLQWISPGDEKSQQLYIEALNAAGFDDFLAKIGESLGMDGLVAFQVTFIAVSHSSKGFMHYDNKKSGAKAYNIIIPLILANDTGPELDVKDSKKVEIRDSDWLDGIVTSTAKLSMLGDDAMVSADSCLILSL